jgi:SAM-dependent methyltransferase
MAQFHPKNYWEDRLSKHYDLNGVGYLGFGKSFNDWMYRLRRTVVTRAVRELGVDVSKASVLDVGSGTGFYIQLWRDLHAGQITGADLTEFAVKQLREKFPAATFYQTDIGNPPPTGIPGQFDLISCMDVVFHIVDDARYQQAFANIAALLKPGGHFVFSENFIHRPTVRGEHHVSRSMDDVLAAVKAAGLEVVTRRPLFYLMNAPIDTPLPWLTPVWQKIMHQVNKSELVGWATGLGLYLTDNVLVQLAKEGPTTELMVCRKP